MLTHPRLNNQAWAWHEQRPVRSPRTSEGNCRSTCNICQRGGKKKLNGVAIHLLGLDSVYIGCVYMRTLGGGDNPKRDEIDKSLGAYNGVMVMISALIIAGCMYMSGFADVY